MKSFLLKDKTPIIKWGSLPDGVLFQGKVPEGYQLAVCPSVNYIIIDIDNHGKISGFDNIPEDIFNELLITYNYKTKNNGMHCWLKYTGNKVLANKTSGLGIDLRTNKGYAVWYPEEKLEDCIPYMKNTSLVMNKWLEKLFSYKEEEELVE